MSDSVVSPSILEDGTVYSRRKNFCPFISSPPDAYAPVIGEKKMERLYTIAQKMQGKRLLDLNSTAQGGGVAEILYSAIPFLNMLGIDAEWKVVSGNEEYFECTKKCTTCSRE